MLWTLDLDVDVKVKSCLSHPMKIGELAAAVGVSTRAIRYYEECGLLSPERTAAGYRVFDERAVITVQRIKILLSAGLPTSAIAEILPCVTDDSVVLAGRCPELLDGLAAHRRRITEEVDNLLAARDILDGLVGRPLSITATAA